MSDATTLDTAAERRMRITVWRLFFCQALMQASVVGQVAMSGIVGASLSGSTFLATLPMAIQMLAVMLASIPAGMIFARFGRKAGFNMGAVASLVGSLLFASGVYQGSFLIYCIGSAFAGVGFGIAQHYRFAAAEVTPPAFRARSISLVMTGPIFSAVLGPELVKGTFDLFPPFLFLPTYLCLAVLPLACLTLLAGTQLPAPPPRAKVATPVADIIARPAFVTAVVAGLVAYGTMNLLMTATPLEMRLCGFELTAPVTVIQWHALAMFAPGFITGRLITRFGMRPVILAGVALNMACVAVTLSGETFWHFIAGLMLLGVGWNFMFVGATALLATSHSPQERIRAQTANDLIVFGTVACTALLSGIVHDQLGWTAINIGVLPGLVVALALIAWQQRQASRKVQPA
ncbi:MFS transporter [Rhodovarius crocodyli]|uniref:MFS transporter n=1 Tax=Rhodovarius crocodyli TaxID=1979269 RepID=A0A437M214_9PROT|nr:MFS transporter [Rhodovarius crocodyli]RVT91593.1 MFS transporter [Rhodovarius crocodyli]